MKLQNDRRLWWDMVVALVERCQQVTENYFAVFACFDCYIRFCRFFRMSFLVTLIEIRKLSKYMKSSVSRRGKTRPQMTHRKGKRKQK